ncbi:MAG: hypothetical protein IJE20_03560 [Phascolarctobacterium sp.]|nr:hypothetical protein [Phascolarctobacterium sp.]
MNKFTKWIVVPMLCLAANFATAANIKDYPTVAVMEFGNKAITSRGLRGHDMAMATEYAIYQLSNCGWFDLIDYEQLSTIAKMHAINMSGMVDQGTAVQMGKVLGAQFMVSTGAPERISSATAFLPTTTLDGISPRFMGRGFFCLRSPERSDLCVFLFLLNFSSIYCRQSVKFDKSA